MLADIMTKALVKTSFLHLREKWDGRLCLNRTVSSGGVLRVSLTNCDLAWNSLVSSYCVIAPLRKCRVTSLKNLSRPMITRRKRQYRRKNFVGCLQYIRALDCKQQKWSVGASCLTDKTSHNLSYQTRDRFHESGTPAFTRLPFANSHIIHCSKASVGVQNVLSFDVLPRGKCRSVCGGHGSSRYLYYSATPVVAEMGSATNCSSKPSPSYIVVHFGVNCGDL